MRKELHVDRIEQEGQPTTLRSSIFHAADDRSKVEVVNVLAGADDRDHSENPVERDEFHRVTRRERWHWRESRKGRGGWKFFATPQTSWATNTPRYVAPQRLPGDCCFSGSELDDAWEKLNALAVAEFPGMRVERGVEVALDIPHPRLDDDRLRLAGTSYALVEFPYMSIPPNSTLAVRELVRSGITPIIAHPERYAGMAANPDLLESWRDSGARIQVNSGSLLGYYGANPKRLAWQILAQGTADYLSSDYHSRGKCPVAECAAAMKEKGGEAQHRLLTTTNSRRILLDEPPLPVPPLMATEPSIWKRVMPWR